MPGAFDTINNHTHEILNAIPKWYIRFGMLILVGVFGLLLAVSTLVSYPDYLETEGYIKINTTAGQPDSNTYWFIARLPQRYMPMAKKGWGASVILDGLPAAQYGDASGVTDSILAPAASDKTIAIRLRLQSQPFPAGQLKDSLTGTAVFLLGERSLFRQLFR